MTTQRSAASAGVGSPAALRAANAARLQDALDRRGPLTQAELARETGLSPATVSNLVKELRSRQQVRTAPVTSSGRRATLVTATTAGPDRVAVGVDIGRKHLTVLLGHRSGRLLAHHTEPIADLDPRQLIARVAQIVPMALGEAGLDRSAVVGAGVALPGAIDPIDGSITVRSTLPEWDGIAILQELEQALGLSVQVGNDANLGALAQARWGPHAGTADLVYVKVGSGIGAGVVCGGRLLAGAAGAAGELGHVPVDQSGPLCRCGNRGCLEAYASTRAMLDAIATHHGRQDVDGLITLALRGDPGAQRVVTDAGFVLGGVLASAVTLLNPEVVVLGGPMTRLGPLWLESVRRGLLRHAGVLTAQTPVEASTLGDRAVALGGCALAFDHALLTS